jgi:hypothetical protein
MISSIRICCLVAAATISMTTSATAQQQPAQEMVRPSQTDPSIRQFDDPNIVLLPAGESASQPPLALFLPGSKGKPENAERLMQVVAGQGYRVIGLMYNDFPAASQVCHGVNNPGCFTGFHAMRAFGQGPAPVTNSYAESIEGRLVSLLHYLDHEHPGAGWSAYLTVDGHPEWSRILVSGLSQGAGMAAHIAKLHPVYRVVLFSSPWDNTGRDHRPAAWLSEPSATPMDRWWAERHLRENTTDWIANAYRALRIPDNHIFLFDQGLPEGQTAEGANPYHPSTIRNEAYAPLWKQLYGMPTAP